METSYKHILEIFTANSLFATILALGMGQYVFAVYGLFAAAISIFLVDVINKKNK